MALKAVNIKIGQSIGEGRYSATNAGGSLPVPTLTTLLADIAAAIAAAGGSHDSTTELTTIQTDANALVLSQTADVSIVWDGTTITKRNQLREALKLALKAVDSGYGGLAE